MSQYRLLYSRRGPSRALAAARAYLKAISHASTHFRNVAVIVAEFDDVAPS
jgi:hypothetical protein